MNEQREAFEAERFGEKVPGVTTPKFDPDTGYYYGSSNQAAWEGFQMAWECTKARAERFDAVVSHCDKWLSNAEQELQVHCGNVEFEAAAECRCEINRYKCILKIAKGGE